MDANLELLNYIYQNAQMGQDTLTQLIDLAEQPDFLQMLRDKQTQYKAVFDECDKRINAMSSKPKEIGRMAEFSTHSMICLQTLADKTPCHMAEMLMQGSIMGIIDIIKNLKKYKDVDSSIVALGNRLMEIEEKNLQECKKFL